jgi:hypothetical protein
MCAKLPIKIRKHEVIQRPVQNIPTKNSIAQLNLSRNPYPYAVYIDKKITNIGREYLRRFRRR